MADLEIQIKGLDEVRKALQKFPKEMELGLGDAGKDVAKMILSTRGLQRYPPVTKANLPPLPFYIRGRGTQTARGNKHNSERMGTKFTIETDRLTTTIGNSASYARYVVGEEQAQFMAPKGWRRLIDVGEEKTPQITRKYQSWINLLLKRLGL